MNKSYKLASSVPTEVEFEQVSTTMSYMIIAYNEMSYIYPDWNHNFASMDQEDFNILWNGKDLNGVVVNNVRLREIINKSIRLHKKNGFDFHNENLVKQVCFLQACLQQTKEEAIEWSNIYCFKLYSGKTIHRKGNTWYSPKLFGD